MAGQLNSHCIRSWMGKGKSFTMDETLLFRAMPYGGTDADNFRCFHIKTGHLRELNQDRIKRIIAEEAELRVNGYRKSSSPYVGYLVKLNIWHYPRILR